MFEAYAEIGVSLGMLINYTGPAIVIALSPLFLKERITAPKVASLVAALLGAFFISGQAAIKGSNTWGLLCAGLSAVAYAVMVLSNKMAKEIAGTENATIQLFCTAVVVTVFVGIKQGFSIEIESTDWGMPQAPRPAQGASGVRPNAIWADRRVVPSGTRTLLPVFAKVIRTCSKLSRSYPKKLPRRICGAAVWLSYATRSLAFWAAEAASVV